MADQSEGKISSHQPHRTASSAPASNDSSSAYQKIGAGSGQPARPRSYPVGHKPHHRPESPVRVVIWSGSRFGAAASSGSGFRDGYEYRGSPRATDQLRSNILDPLQEGRAAWIRSGARPGEAIVRTADAATEIIRWFKGLLITFSALAAVPLAGLIGFRHGFAEVLGVPELSREFGSSLSDGVRLVLFAPRRVFDAGMLDTPTLILAVAFLVLGVGGLALTVVRMTGGGDGSRARTEGADDVVAAGPGGWPSSSAWASSEEVENPFVPVMRIVGDIIVLLVSVIQVGWALARYREMFAGGMIPLDHATFATWVSVVRTTAGIDLVLLAAAIIWLIVAVRLHTPNWLRVLTIVLAAFMVMSLWAQAAMSNSVISQVDQIRSVFVTPSSSSALTSTAPTTASEASSPHSVMIDATILPPGSKNLIVGHTASHLVVINDKAQGLRFVPTTIEFEVNSRMTMPEFIEHQRALSSSPSEPVN